jgi:protoporphyrinogen oxidase
MLGMTLALRLSQRGHAVTLFEGAPQFGGLASAWRLGDVTWDRHYHVTLLSDSHLRALLSELDLDSHMQWRVTRTGFFTGGKLYSMSDALEFLRFPPLGLIPKFRLGMTILKASRTQDWQALEKIPVAEWLERNSGTATFRQIWLPLLRAKLGENYTRVSAAFIWATIQRLYAARRSGLKREMFGYLPGGYARLLEVLTERLRAGGVTLRPGSAVSSVEAAHGGGLNLSIAGSPPEHFDQVVLTTPTPVSSRLAPGLQEVERKLLEGVEYQGIVCASLLLKKKLADYYVTNITDSGLPFTAVIEMTALVDPASFGGRALVYLPRYVASDDPLFGQPDDAIRDSFLAGLERMYPDFRRDDVEHFGISRVKNVFALPTLEYSRRLPPMETSIPGLHMVNSAHIVNGTLNVNETVRLAEEAASRLT